MTVAFASLEHSLDGALHVHAALVCIPLQTEKLPYTYQPCELSFEHHISKQASILNTNFLSMMEDTWYTLSIYSQVFMIGKALCQKLRALFTTLHIMIFVSEEKAHSCRRS